MATKKTNKKTVDKPRKQNALNTVQGSLKPVDISKVVFANRPTVGK